MKFSCIFFQSVAISLAFLLAGGCMRPSPESMALQSTDVLPHFPCEGDEGQPESFSIGPVERLPLPLQLGWTGISPTKQLLSPGHNGGFKLRLDVCVGESLTLKRVVYQYYPESPIDVIAFYQAKPMSGPDSSRYAVHIVNQSEYEVQGLDEAIYNQKYAGFLVRVKLKSGRGMLLQGYESGDLAFIAVARLTTGAAGETKYSGPVLIGQIIQKDPFSGLACPPGRIHKMSGFRLGTARFATEQCQFLGGGSTAGYVMLKVSVKDENPALDPANQAEFTFQGKELTDKLTYNYLHHNWCDTFRLALPHAQYAITSSSPAACPKAEDLGMPNSDSSPDGVTFSMKYPGADWEKTVVTGCLHHLLDCPTP